MKEEKDKRASVSAVGVISAAVRAGLDMRVVTERLDSAAFDADKLSAWKDWVDGEIGRRGIKRYT